MPKDNYPRPSLSQQESDFLKRFSLRKFTVPKDKLQEHSPVFYHQNNESMDLDQFPPKRVRIEYKELKRSLKTNVPWWLRTKGLEEDMNTERLATLVEDSEDDYYSARLDAGVDRPQAITSSQNVECASEAHSATISPKLSSSSRRGIQLIEEFLKITEGSNKNIPDHTLNEIIEVEKRLSRVHGILNNLEHVRLKSGCEKCQGKPKNDSVQCDNNDQNDISEQNNYPEVSLNAPETRYCVCDLECVDTEIEKLCCCLQKLLEEKGLCDDPCHYATIIERLQEIRQSLSDFTKRVMLCSEDALYPDPLSEKFQKKDYLNGCEKEQSSTELLQENCEEKPPKSKEKTKGKSCSCFGKKNNSDAYDVASSKKKSMQKKDVTKTDSSDECGIEQDSGHGENSEKAKPKLKEKKSKKNCACFGKNASFEQTEIQPSSRAAGPETCSFENDQFYICCKETQTDYENCDVKGRPMFIPCLVLKQALVEPSSSFDLPSEDNRPRSKGSQDYLQPSCKRSSTNNVELSDSQKQCMCEENFNADDACTDMYFCTPINQNSTKDDERCKDRPQAGISKVENKSQNVCPHCSKCIRPQFGQSVRDSVGKVNVEASNDRKFEIKEARGSYALKVGHPKSHSSGEIPLRNKSAGKKETGASKGKEDFKECNTTQTSVSSTKAERKGVSFSKIKENSTKFEKSKICSPTPGVMRKSSTDERKTKDKVKDSKSRDGIQCSERNSKTETKNSLTSETKSQGTSEHVMRDKASNIEAPENKDSVRRLLRKSIIDTSAHTSKEAKGAVNCQHVANTRTSTQQCSKEKSCSKIENTESNASVEGDVKEHKISGDEDGNAGGSNQQCYTTPNETPRKGSECEILDAVKIQKSKSTGKVPDYTEKKYVPLNESANEIKEIQEPKTVQSKNDDPLKDTKPSPPLEMEKLQSHGPSKSEKFDKSKILPQPKVEDVQVKIQEPSYEEILADVKGITATQSKTVDKCITEELGKNSKRPEILEEMEKFADPKSTPQSQIKEQDQTKNQANPNTELGEKKECKSKAKIEKSDAVPKLDLENASHALTVLSHSNGRRNDRALKGCIEQKPVEEIKISKGKTDRQPLKPFEADPNISQPEQEIRVCLCNKRRSLKSSKRNGVTGGTEIGKLSTKMPTNFCNNCFGKDVPIIKSNLANEIRKMIGNRKRNSVFLKFSIVKDDLYHMQMSTENTYLGCLYATESATFAARDANGFDGCTTLSVTDKSNTRMQIESLVDHAFMVVQQEKRSSN